MQLSSGEIKLIQRLRIAPAGAVVQATKGLDGQLADLTITAPPKYLPIGRPPDELPWQDMPQNKC